MCVLNNVLHNTLAQVSAWARFMSSTWSSTLCGCPFFDSLFLTLFLSVCFSYPFFFYLNPELNLFLRVVVIGAKNHWHSAKWGGPLAENTPFHKQEEKTRCVVTVNKLKDLIPTSVFKENWNNRQTTRTEKRAHGGIMPKERRQGSTERFLRTSRILVKNSQAISKLMKCSRSQTQCNARRVTIRHTLDTHIALVDRQIQEQVAKSRNKFSNTSWVVSKYPRRVHPSLELWNHQENIGTSEVSHLYHQARDHLKSARKKCQNQHSWSISGR